MLPYDFFQIYSMLYIPYSIIYNMLPSHFPPNLTHTVLLFPFYTADTPLFK